MLAVVMVVVAVRAMKGGRRRPVGVLTGDTTASLKPDEGIKGLLRTPRRMLGGASPSRGSEKRGGGLWVPGRACEGQHTNAGTSRTLAPWWWGKVVAPRVKGEG